MANIMRLGGGAGGGKVKGIPLSDLPHGSLIALRESGVLTPFYLAKHDYEADLNGEGRTLLVRKDLESVGVINSAGKNAYAESTVDVFLNGTKKDSFSSIVKAQMGATTFRYTIGNGNKTVTTLTRSIFLLSVTEFGLTATGANVEGSALPIASLIQIGYYNGVATNQATRTPYTNNTTDGCLVASIGIADGYNSTWAVERVARFGFTLPATMEVNPDPNSDGSYTLLCEEGQTELSKVSDGASLYIEEDGVLQPFVIAAHNYNGNGGVLLVRKDVHSNMVLNSSSNNTYAGSNLDNWLNGTYLAKLPQAVQDLLLSCSIASNSSNIVRKGFILSATELGFSQGSQTVEGTKLAIASTLQRAYMNGVVTTYWTRSKYTGNGTNGYTVMESSGSMILAQWASTTPAGARPCFALPSSLVVEGFENGYKLV